MSTNYLALANYSFPTVNASSITVGSSINMNQAAFSTLTGSTITVSTLTGSTLNAGRITVSTIAFQSTTIALGQSTNQAYNNFTNGSFTAGWASTLSTTASTAGAGLSRVQRVTMSQSGQYQLAVQSSVASYSVVKSSDSGVTWQTLTNGSNGLPAGSPAYTSISYSATGQYALAAVNPGGLYVSNNATAATPTFTSITFAPYAYLPMETTPPTDTMGNSNPVSTGTPALATGQVGNAINLANTMGSTATKYIRGTWSGSNNFTVSGRFNAQSVTAGQYGIIFSALGTGITLYITDTAALVFFIGSSPTAGLGTGSNYITANTWYSFTIIYQLGSTSSIYINGTLIGSVSNTGAVTNAYARSNQFCLGTYDNALGNAFNGYIDEFRIYNYATIATNFTHTAVSATGQYMLAAAAGGGLFQSTNFGQTWTQVNAVLNGGVWTSLSQSESGQYALATTSAASIMPQLTGLTAATWSTNGVSWASSASSTYSGYQHYYLFNNSAANAWLSALSMYNTTSGAYNAGPTSTTILGGIGAIAGEWVQIQSSIPIVLQSYSYSDGGNVANIPKTYYIVGSNDGSTWYPLQYVVMSTNPFTTPLYSSASTYITLNTSGSFTIQGTVTGQGVSTAYAYNTQSYTYFRMVITNIWGSNAGYCEFTEWAINFVGGLACTSNYGQTWSNNNFLGTAQSFSAISGDGQYTLTGTGQTAYLIQNYLGLATQSYTIAPYNPAILSNLVYYPFNDTVGSTTAADTMYGYNATVSGTVTFGATGKAGTAATIGASGYLALPSTLYSRWNNLTAGSISCWIYPTTLGGSYTLFNKQDNSSTPYSLLGINYTAAGATTITNKVYFSMTNTLYNASCSSNTVLAINTWYHIVVTFNGTAIKFYINGVLDNTYTASWTLANQPSPTNMTIGGAYNGSSTYSNFVGTIDEFSLWTSELSLSSVQAMYNSGNPITPANICGAASSNTGQYMVIVTQGTTNNVYYSTNYGSTWTALTVGSSAMTSCVMSVDGTYITVSNATNVYTLNWNGQGFTVALGSAAGAVNQASNAIAIGNQAGQTNQTANSIVLNASGAAVNPYTQGFYVAPIQPAISSLARTFPLLGYGSDNQIVQSATSFSNSQQTVYGEWIQYQLATASPITSYTLQGRLSAAFRYPASWIIVGSNDGTNWTLLDTQTGTSGWGTYTLTQATAAYTYYRMIITQIPSAAAYYVDIGGFILNNGSPIFGASANYTVVASGLYNILQLNGTTVCTTTFSWPNTIPVNSLGIGADNGANATYQPGWIPTTDGYTRTSNYFLGFNVTAFGPAYEYNASGIATQGTSTTINTTVLGNTNMAGTLCLMNGSRVGIGSTTPQYALDVAGTAQLNGTIPAYGQPDSAAVVPNSTFGQTWTVIPGLLTNGIWFGAAVSATGQYMTINTAGTSVGLVWYSSNYGSTWTQSGLAAANYGNVAMSGNGQYQIIGIGSPASAIYLSSNYGVTWAAISGLSAHWFRYALSYSGQYQYLVSGTFIYYSSNYGASFTTVSAGAYYTICCSSSGQYVYAGTQSGFILYSTNYGVSWSQSSSASAVWTSICCSASGQYVTAMRNSSLIYYSNDYGVNWTGSGLTTTGGFGLCCSASGQYQMVTLTGTYVYYSTNYGVSWTQSSSATGNWQCVSMSQNGLYAIAAMNTGAVYLSTLANVGLVTNGRVGIGVTNPVCPLIIQSGNISLSIANRGHIQIQDTSGISRFTAGYDTSYAYVQSWNSTPLILNALGNNVGIGTTTPGSALHVCGATSGASPLFLQNTSGSGNTWGVGPNNAGQFVIALNSTGVYVAPGGQSWAAGSDIRLKDDITSLSNCLQNINNLRPVSYRLKKYQNTSFKKLGFIAQEVQPILPELVVENGMDGMLGLLYTEFTPVIIGAIQELAKQLTVQTSVIAALEARLAALEAK